MPLDEAGRWLSEREASRRRMRVVVWCWVAVGLFAVLSGWIISANMARPVG